MSVCFSSAFLIEDVRLSAHLGIYDEERANLQPISISIRLYFPSPPAWTFDDSTHFFDYQILIERLEALIASRSFRLIEYMAQECLKNIREHLDATSNGDFKIWIKLTKLAPPLPQLKGGASYVMTDLLVGAPVLDVA